jgi:hypothetical protein
VVWKGIKREGWKEGKVGRESPNLPLFQSSNPILPFLLVNSEDKPLILKVVKQL